MGTEAFIQPGVAFAVPLMLLSVFLIATRPHARPYLLPVLLGSLLVGIGGVGTGPFQSQVIRFAVFFTFYWLALGLLAFLIWLVITTLTGNKSDEERVE